MRIAIVVEGDTEYYFVYQVLAEKFSPSWEIIPINLGGGKISIERLKAK